MNPLIPLSMPGQMSSGLLYSFAKLTTEAVGVWSGALEVLNGSVVTRSVDGRERTIPHGRGLLSDVEAASVSVSGC